MGHLGEGHRRPPLARSRVSVSEGRLDRGEEAATRRVLHQDESAQSQFLRYALLRVRDLELFKFGRYICIYKSHAACVGAGETEGT